MIKLNVLKQFHDKETNELYKIGSVIEVTEKRAKEIIASKLKVAELAEGEKLGDDDDVSGKSLEDLTLKQLQKLAKEKNITVDGKTKEDYLNALKDVE